MPRTSPIKIARVRWVDFFSFIENSSFTQNIQIWSPAPPERQKTPVLCLDRRRTQCPWYHFSSLRPNTGGAFTGIKQCLLL